MSAIDLFRDMATDLAREQAAAISPEYRDYRAACRTYQEAALAVQTMANEAAKWKQREVNARKRLAEVVQEFKYRNWMLP
jgi:hypothetical protein